MTSTNNKLPINLEDRAEATRLWNFPYAAIEEAVANAVYHRSYEEREPIEVRIGHDELAVVRRLAQGKSPPKSCGC